MQVAVSLGSGARLPEGATTGAFRGSVIDTEFLEPHITQSYGLANYHALKDLSNRLDFDLVGLHRPEIFSNNVSLEYLRGLLPNLRAHVFLGPLHEFKYLVGVKNFVFPTLLHGHDNRRALAESLAQIPYRNAKIDGRINGYAYDAISTRYQQRYHQFLVPFRTKNEIDLLRNATNRVSYSGVDLVSVVLKSSAPSYAVELMQRRVMSLHDWDRTTNNSQRPRIVMVANIDLARDVPTALAPLVRHLSFSTLTGYDAGLIINLENQTALSDEVISRTNDLLLDSLTRFTGSRVDLEVGSVYYSVIRGHKSLKSLLDIASYAVLFDHDCIDTPVGQVLCLSGLRPLFLKSTASQMFGHLCSSIDNSVCIDSVDHFYHYGQISDNFNATDIMPYPSQSSLQRLLTEIVTGPPLSENERTANLRKVNKLVENSIREFETIISGRTA